MARYRKVEVALWSDDRFLSLSHAQPNGQTLWLYLLCGPRTTTFPGLIVARAEVMASDLGWLPQTFHETFAELSAQGLVKVDWKVGLVMLRKALFDSLGEPRETAKPSNPNQLKHWSLSWETVPECDLKFEYLEQLECFAKALGETFEKGFREGWAKPLAKRLARPSRIQDSGFRTQETGIRIERDSETPAALGSSLELFKSKVDASAPEINARHAHPRKPRAPKRPTFTAIEKSIAMRVLAKLTERSRVRYTGCDDHVALIAHHLRRGVTEHELRGVIAYCADELEWLDDPKMHRHLKPETLFGPKTLSRYLDPSRTYVAENNIPFIDPVQEAAS